MSIKWSRTLKNQAFGMLLVAPATLLLSVTILIPLARSISTSFRGASLLSAEQPFIGLANYRALLSGQEFYHALSITLRYVACTVGIEIVLGLASALLLNSRIRFRAFFRSILLIPWAIPTLVAALVFLLIYQADYGVLNGLLIQSGLTDKKLNVLNDLNLALYGIMGVAIWRQTPLAAVMTLAGLQGVPRDWYEAATIDGASKLKTFLYITLPALKPVLANVTLLMVVANFQMFTLFYALTGGGPADATQSLAIYTYETAFQAYDLGKGSAIGVIWMLLLLLIAVPLNRVAHRSMS
ncbi:carbohydrate ABC transporter permease [Paenibacillus sp. NPDC057934]|uniref:carbohydrate ABC transporter permease n=1 Tax=Paenibacillus sp. NPDC057934 TaxID=3346282 RepID=UPI0036DE4983